MGRAPAPSAGSNGSSMAEDYYKTLGVSRDASPADIQKAYRDLARKFHPDLNPDDTTAKQKFQAVQAAFDVLGDPKKRELYDRYGSSFEGAAAGGRRPGQTRSWSPGGGAEDFDFSQFFGERFGGDPAGGFADIFSQFRSGRPASQGRKARPSARTRGTDIQYEVPIPFATSIVGGEAQLTVSRASGKVETIQVKIPRGIEDGKKIRLRGQGEAAVDGGAPGDILITVRVAPHPFFTRRGDNLHVRLPVTLREAARGAKIDVPTPKGMVALRVPSGTSSGTKLRIKGYGAAPAGRPAGDLFADIQIVLPPKLDEHSLEGIDQVDARHPLDPRRDLKW